MTVKSQRYESLKSAIGDKPGITSIELDEEWIPPHKMAAFTPYDAIVTLEDTNDTRWTHTEFDDLLAQHRVNYDRVITVESDGDGTHTAFISLATTTEQGIQASSD